MTLARGVGIETEVHEADARVGDREQGRAIVKRVGDREAADEDKD